jgi:integrase
MRKTLTDRGVTALKPRPQRYALPDPELRGHYVRVQPLPSGAKSFWTVARSPAGRQIWTLIGPADTVGIDEARKKARTVLERVRAGLPAVEAPPTAPDSFKSVAEQWLKRHVQAKGLRSEPEWTRLLREHVYPRWADRAFLGIGRADVTGLLDEIEDDHGARQADHTLSVIRAIMKWQAARIDAYVPPIVAGMRRTNPKERERNRILDDAELRLVWQAAEADGSFGALIRLLLLTAQRREKVVSMKWSDVSVDGVWSIPTDPREKGNAGELKLPELALDIIRKQPRIRDNPYVFAGRGDAHINGYSKSKRAFDAKLPVDTPAWTLHDLRRTARSLMSRAGVSAEHAERVLGHRQQGVRGIYDRHEYHDEKRDALAKLAALIDGIVHPKDNVLPMAGKRRK